VDMFYTVKTVNSTKDLLWERSNSRWCRIQ